MNFINGLRRSQGIAGGALRHPLAVAPLVVEIPHHGGGAGRFFVPKAEGVGFVDMESVALRLDMAFVKRAFSHAGDEPFPDAGAAARRKQVGLGMPIVEAPDHRNLARVRSPDTEDRTVE